MQHARRRGRSTASYIRLMITIVFVFAVSCTVTMVCLNTVGRYNRELEAQRGQLTNQVDALHDQLEYVRSDAYVERVARDEFGLIKPGEIRYVTN